MNAKQTMRELIEVQNFIRECNKICNNADDPDLIILAHVAYNKAIETRHNLIQYLLTLEDNE